MYNTQVSLEHYEFLKYVDEPRWCSYYKQIEEICNCNMKSPSVLIIGVGDGFVPYIINKIAPSIKVETYDFANDLEPDICGDIRELLSKVGGGKWSVVVCCQVLEHLPYDEFEGILYQIGQCLETDGKVVLSLPDSGVRLQLLVHILGFSDIKFLQKKPRIWRTEFKFNGEHYWEINSARPYSVKRVRKVIKNMFNIEREYLVRNNPYHRFFILSRLP